MIRAFTNTRIKLCEAYKAKFPKSNYDTMVEHSITEQKEEKFAKTD